MRRPRSNGQPPESSTASAFSTRTEPSVVMAGLSRPKDGVASLAYVPAIHALLCSQGVDARDKRGHDVERLVQTNWKPL